MQQVQQVQQVQQGHGHCIIQMDLQTSTPSLLSAALTLDGWDSSSRLTITCNGCVSWRLVAGPDLVDGAGPHYPGGDDEVGGRPPVHPLLPLVVAVPGNLGIASTTPYRQQLPSLNAEYPTFSYLQELFLMREF